MPQTMELNATILVIYGASGDLTYRLLMPALYDLYLDGWVPEHFAVIGVGRTEMSDDAFRGHLREGVDQFSRRCKSDDPDWAAFASHLSYKVGDPTVAGTQKEIAQRLKGLEKEWNTEAGHVFYMATPPMVFAPIAKALGAAGLARKGRARLVVEKPFGHDLASARELNRQLTDVFDESCIFRIDHYLGKETVQNILAFRFGNALFEPIWDRRYIDHVQITVAEDIGVGDRGGYYDHAGALRDMVQNHLIQVLCLVAMEPPVSFDANEVRDKKVEVLRAIRPIPPAEIQHFAARGQFGEGWIEGKHVIAYREAPKVAKNSPTETFVAVKFFIDNWRWQGVPFYLRTGKRMGTRASEVNIQFRPVPHNSFPDSTVGQWLPNRLMIHIQPNEGISLLFMAKQPGSPMRLNPVTMRFSYREAFDAIGPEAYETLLLDIIRGDSTLFMRADQVEAAWTAVMPILDNWESTRPLDFPNYRPGSWGPESAETLIAQDGRTWFEPMGANHSRRSCESSEAESEEEKEG